MMHAIFVVPISSPTSISSFLAILLHLPWCIRDPPGSSFSVACRRAQPGTDRHAIQFLLLVDQNVVGRYLEERTRDLLYELAQSESLWERRTAIVATAYFLRHDQLDDTFAIAETLLNVEEDLIHKAVGGWLRHAGKQDQPRLLAFLERHAARMPRTMLTYAVEHLDAEQKAHFRGLAA